ncbi:MAG: hypothetical protein M1592_02825 [Candidatus Thermoplasmatota archaeon]|nr:hypothetical protein [Candidatus Thermoplasmatota archaeon]
MMVYCIHYLFVRNGKLMEIPPRTVEKLEEAGVVITLDGKPEGTLIQMNWEPEPDGTTWTGETELSDTVKAVAHLIEGIPDQENESCEVYRESIGKGL